ncbi:MAG: GEVED domain-containing protein [Pseudanabaena sp. CAN_BIN31]|nr:GEVED domain-containing protein [Pseudanabaena sp. CAN_BIN31]
MRLGKLTATKFMGWLRLRGQYLLMAIFTFIIIWVTAERFVLPAIAEGSFQLGPSPGTALSNQALIEYDSPYSDPGSTTTGIQQLNRPLYIDIASAGEVINVSACGNNFTDDWEVDLYYLGIDVADLPAGSSYPPFSGSLVFGQVGDATTSDVNFRGQGTFGTVATNATCNQYNLLSTANMDLLTPAPPFTTDGSVIKYTTTQSGVYEVRLRNRTNGSNPPVDFRQFDISVTTSTAANPNPQTASGRLWSYVWGFNANSFDDANSTDGDYYIVVPGGVSGTNFVWRLDLNHFAGFVYQLVANNRGVDSPNSLGVNVRGISVPIPGNNVTPQYRQYLSFPTAKTYTRPTSGPTISNLRFEDNTGEDDVITPGLTTGIQDTGFFRFTSSLPGTYEIIIDTNQDGSFALGDVQLRGDTDAFGNVSAEWNGRNNLGVTLPVGTYNAQVRAIIGEYHFIAGDVETSGGTFNGLTLSEATPGAPTPNVPVYWDDVTVLGPSGGATIPNGQLSNTIAGRHTWGSAYGNSSQGSNGNSWGDRRYIDTYVYGNFTVGNVPAIIADAESRDYGDAPDTYGTDRTNSSSEGIGPSQILSLNTLLGTVATDSEANGQPTTTANGDDINGTDDEDSVASFATLTTNATSYSVTIRVKNTPVVAASAYLGGWIDFNKDGKFTASEGVIQVVPNATNGNVTLTWTGLSGLTIGNTIARFRINNALLTTSDFIGGSAKGNGEVEDYQLAIVAPASTEDYGDAPDTGIGTATGNYQTTQSDGGARHTVVAGLRLGTNVDIDDGTLQNLNADADDINGIGGTGPDDEDGVTTFPTITTAPNVSYTVSNVAVTNTTGANAFLVGYIDFNKDGVFNNAAPERSATVTIPNNGTTANVTFTNVPAGITAGNTYARFRISSTQSQAESSIGASTSGEVEDYRISIVNTAAIDYGDAVDTGAGTGIGNYTTLLSQGGPSHNIIPELRLGALIDAETGTLQNPAATADDTTNTDDEDGVASFPTLTTVSGLTYTLPVTFSNTTGGNAFLVGYIDFNRDGDFLDAGEQSVTVTVANGSTSANLLFTTPAGISAGTSYARIRISSTQAQAQSSVGTSTSGEVEDYSVTIIATDYGDAPDASAGTTVGNYNTRAVDAGASHIIVTGLSLGNTIDADDGTLQNANADADDTTNSGALDDEDGVIAFPALTDATAQNYLVQVATNNNTGANAFLVGYIDFNRDGDFSDPNEQSGLVTVDNNGLNTAVVSFTTPTLSANITAGVTYARFRYSNTQAQAESPTDASTSGEVEDYRLTIISSTASVDYGDAPDASAGTAVGNYNTRAADSGASHTIVPGLRLGTQVDADSGSLNNANADADDTLNTGSTDDEDAVASFAELNTVSGLTYTVNLTVTNTTLNNAFVSGFIDFNRDGDFLDPNEQSFTSIPNNATTATLNFNTPSGMTTGDTYARFRISSSQSQIVTATGASFSGEVEDYRITIVPPRDYGDAPDTTNAALANDYQTTLANGGASHTILATLKLGANAPDADNGSLQNINANADDNNGIPDDEDGVASFPVISAASTSYTLSVSVNNTSGSLAYLVGWIDFNKNGVFETSEGSTVLNVASPTTTSVNLNWSSIAGLPQPGDTYVHLRLSTVVLTNSAIDAIGLKGNGEVEDYKITVAVSPGFNLVKRITAINLTPITTFVDDPGSLNDNDDKWPDNNALPSINKYLAGAIACNSGNTCNSIAGVKPNDNVEFTIYFLSNGTDALKNVKICDRIPANTTFRPDTYAVGKGILLGWDSTALADPSTLTGTVQLTNIIDVPTADKGKFVAALTALDNPPCGSTTNTDGGVVVDVVSGATIVPIATGAGAPVNSYGFVRFNVTVN